MTNTSDQEAESYSGVFSLTNVSNFISNWWGGGATIEERPVPTEEQVETVENAEQVADSWGLNFSRANLLDALVFVGKQLSTIVPQPSESVKSNLSLDGYKYKSDTGDELVVEDVMVERLGYALIDLSTFEIGVVEMDSLKIGRLAFKNEVMDVEAAIILGKLRLQVGAAEVVKGVGHAFNVAMGSVEDMYYDLLEGNEIVLSKVAQDMKNSALDEIMAHLQVTLGAKVETVDIKLTVRKFGLSDAPSEPILTVGNLNTAELIGKHLQELDLEIGKITIDITAPLDPESSGSGRLEVNDTRINVNIDKGNVQVEASSELDLSGEAKASVEDLKVEVVLKAHAELNLEQTRLAIDETWVAVKVGGSYADTEIEISLMIEIAGLELSATGDKGALLDCLVNQSAQAINRVLKIVIGDGEPIGMTPAQLEKTFSDAALKQVRDAVLKGLKTTLGARVGHFGARIERFRYGDYSSEGEVTVDNLELVTTLDPENPLEMSLTAEVLMSGLLKAKDENLLDFSNISVTLDEVGNGAVTGHFQLHSTGLTEVLGRVLGTTSKAIDKTAKLNIKIVNYAAELNSTNIVMGSRLLNPLIGLILNHVGVNSGPKPALGLTGKILHKKMIKKIVRPTDIGQRSEGDSGDILIDNKQAKAIFENDGSTGAINLIAYLKNAVQTRLDALRDWEPQEPSDEPSVPQGRKVPQIDNDPAKMPLTSKKQLMAAEAVRSARLKLRDATRALELDPQNDKLKTKVTSAEDAVQKAEKKLIEVNVSTLKKARKELEKSVSKQIGSVVDLVKSSFRKKKAPTDKGQLYLAEVGAAQSLLVNNCLIDAIAAGAGLQVPTIPQLVTIRGELGNVGEMMLATPKTVTAILKGLGIAGRTVVVGYPDPIPPEVFAGNGVPIFVRHTGAAHFVADDQEG